MALPTIFRPGMRAYFIPFTAGVVLTASAFLPWVVVEAVEPEHVRTQIGEANRQGIEIRKLLGQRDADVFGVGPLHDVTPSVARRSDLPS